MSSSAEDSEVDVYYSPFSQPSRAVVWLLKLLDVQCNEHMVNLATGDQRKPEYKQNVNFMCKVPALRHGDLRIAESFAILAYVAKKFGADTHWYPNDLAEQSRMHEYISWHISRLQPAVQGGCSTRRLRR